MKCTMCHGTKEVLTATGKSPCPKCCLYDISHEMTNEEWWRTASTDELADWLASLKYNKDDMPKSHAYAKKEWLAWFKAVHDKTNEPPKTTPVKELKDKIQRINAEVEKWGKPRNSK